MLPDFQNLTIMVLPLEKEIAEQIDAAGGSLLGPNNIGMINQHYAGIFTRPLPLIDKKGVDFISASGATAVFTLEAAQQIGLRFSNIFTVGNSAQIGVEDVLEHLDEAYIAGKSSQVKMLYLEGIKNPSKLLKHALSLRQKGCLNYCLKIGYHRKRKRRCRIAYRCHGQLRPFCTSPFQQGRNHKMSKQV